MKSILALAVVATAALTAPVAQAALIQAQFNGAVQAQADAGVAVGDAVSGRFVFDTDTASFVSFSIGGRSVSAGFASLTDTTPDRYSALYQAQVSPVLNPGARNSSFMLDLEGLSPWTGTDAAALLLDSAQLVSNLDTTLSHFGYYTADADGSNVRMLDAALSSVSVGTVPEPGSLALLALALAGAGSAGLRRRQG